MKKTGLIILMLSLLFSGKLFPQQIITAVQNATSCSNEISVAITVQNCNNVSAISLILGFNQNVFTYAGYQQKHAALGSGFFFVNQNNGSIILSWVSLNAVTIGNDTLIVYNFSSTGGTSNLIWDTGTSGNCEYSNTNGQVIPATFVNGSAAVSQPGLVAFAGEDITIPTGTSVWLNGSATGGLLPYSFEWNTGQGSHTILVSPANSTTYTLSVFDSIGCFSTDEITVSVSDEFDEQLLSVPSGWSGISSYLAPAILNLDSFFSPILDKLIILQDESGLYWPEQNINTIGLWSTQSGYKIKVSEASELTIYGDLETDKTLTLNQGWNLIPVISECETDVENLFSATPVNLVKEVAGYGVYWPAYGINTLEYLEPGSAYFVMMANGDEITFPACDGLKMGAEGKNLNGLNPARAGLLGLAPWKLTKATASTHSVAIPASLFADTTVATGDFLGAFDLSGNCFGELPLETQNAVITLFGDDPFTNEKDGFMENEAISFRIYDAETKEETGLSITWEPSLPQHDGLFHTNGLSAVVKSEVLAVGNSILPADGILIYPNPAREELNIIVPVLEGQSVQITNIHGQRLYSGAITEYHTKLDIHQFEKGVYFVMIISERQNWVEKVVVE